MFGGQIQEHYSVMSHSLLVAELAPMHLRYAALLHDASEAYIGDVIKPLKVLLGDVYANIEAKWMAVIGEKYGIPDVDFDKVKHYDKIALEYESNYFRGAATPSECVAVKSNMLIGKKTFIQIINHCYEKLGK
jgi:5'-deoxynucleotidase YfbR-like HD superfamily hydrolase